MSIANLLNSKSFKMQVQALSQTYTVTPITSVNAGIDLTANNIVTGKLLILDAGATAGYPVNLPEPLTVSTALSYNPYDSNLLNQMFEFSIMNLSGQALTLTQSATGDFSVQDGGTAVLAAGQCGRVLYQITRVGNAANVDADPPIAAVTPQMRAYVL